MTFATAPAASEQAGDAAALAYRARIEGGDELVRDRLQALLKLFVLESEPPATLTALERRARRDVETAQLVLRAQGYYDALVRYRIERAERTTVVVSIDPGPSYLLTEYDVRATDGHHDGSAEIVADALGPDWRGRAATADRIEALQAAVMGSLLDSSYALAEVVERRVVVDHRDHALRVWLTIELGERMAFGHLRVVGLVNVPEYYVRRRVPWRIGDRWDATKLATLRAELVSTGLFSSVRARPLTELAAHGRLPVELELSEAKARLVGFGVRYSSSEGFGGQAFWESRNFRHQAERLRITGVGTQQEVGGTFSFRRPDFLSIDQALTADASLTAVNTDAFDASKLAFSTGIERPLTPRTVIEVALAFEFGPVDGVVGVAPGADPDDDRPAGIVSERRYSLLSLPVAWRRDTTDRLLDPARGARTLAELIPYGGVDPGVAFGLGRLSQTVYRPLASSGNLVLAGRIALGSIVGASLFGVPADKRFYSGGGGSVRGYKFQFAGPLTSSDDPIGGRSMFEVGGELRWRVIGNFGVVPFIDGGSVFPEWYPSFNERIFWGAGLGLRYFSVAGPLRLDVATPLNGRSGIDDRVQFYLSLGQAF